jgi:hypothetical protein
MTVPDFFIIGGQRCGTTSLRVYLSSHPGVYMPDREIGFFTRLYDRGIDWYQSLFDPNRLTGEKCPEYLRYPIAAKRISKHLPQAKFIVLLRNPVDRLWSHYHWAVGMNRETKSFETVISNGGDYGKHHGGDLAYLKWGHYAEQLEFWFVQFPRDRFLIIQSEKFFSNPAVVYNSVLQFLELRDDKGIIKFGRHGTVSTKGTMSRDTRCWLADYYRPHNERLEQLLGREFGWNNQVP